MTFMSLPQKGTNRNTKTEAAYRYEMRFSGKSFTWDKELKATRENCDCGSWDVAGTESICLRDIFSPFDCPFHTSGSDLASLLLPGEIFFNVPTGHQLRG